MDGLDRNIDISKNATLVDIQHIGRTIPSLMLATSKPPQASSTSADPGFHPAQGQQENTESDVFDQDDVLGVLQGLECSVFGIVYGVGIALIFTLAALT